MKQTIVFILVIISISFSHSFFDSSSFCVKGGLGGYFSKSSTGYSGYLSASILNKKHSFTFRYIGAKEEDGTGILETPPKLPLESFRDVGLLYGKWFKSERGEVSGMIGLGLFTGIKRGGFLYADPPIAGPFTVPNSPTSHFDEMAIKTLGVPLEGNLSFPIGSHIGLGIGIASNLNTKLSYLSGFLSLEVKNLFFN